MSEFIEKDGKVLPYKVTYKNNKHTYYRIKPGYIDVSASKKYPKALIHTFLTTHFDRFYEGLYAQEVERDDQIYLWDKQFELRVMDGNFKYDIVDDVVYLKCRGDINEAKKRIYLDQIKMMCESLNPIIKPVLDRERISLLPLKFRYLKSKFGSYHRVHNDITLNTVLAKFDPIILTYVLYHEYAHTKVFNHSSRFYSVLDRLMPTHRTIQKRLKNVVIM